MSESESVTVKEGYYDNLGTYHCGVIRGFKVTCGPEMKVMEEGDEHTFEISGITAKRSGDEVTFSKAQPALT